MSFIEQDNNNSLDCHQCKRNLEIKIYKIGEIAKYDSKLDFNPKSISNLNQMQK